MIDDAPHVDGELLDLMGGDDPEEPHALRRITRIEIVGKLAAHVAEMPLKHGQYEGTPYSTGTADLGDRTFYWVVTEGDEGVQIGARVLPVSDPTSGQFYEGVVHSAESEAISTSSSRNRYQLRLFAVQLQAFEAPHQEARQPPAYLSGFEVRRALKELPEHDLRL